MRKQVTIIAVLLGCILFSGCEKKEKFTVTGRLETYVEDYIPQPTLSIATERRIMKDPIVKGELFQFHGKVGKPKMAFVEFNEGANHWAIILEPGDIVLDPMSQCGIGTPLNEAFRDCENRISKIMISQKETMVYDMKDEMLAIIDEHPDDVIGVYYLSRCFVLLDQETIDAIIAKAGPGFTGSKLFKNLRKAIKEYFNNPNPEQTESSDGLPASEL